MPTSITTANRNRAADAVTARCNGGTIRLYGGAVPSDVDAPLGGATLLATLALSATAFAPAVSGVASANAVTSAPASAGAPTTATFFRTVEADGTTFVFQGNIASSGAELNMPNTSITQDGMVNVTALTYTQYGTSA